MKSQRLVVGTLCFLALAGQGCRSRPDPITAGVVAAQAALGEDYRVTIADQVPVYYTSPQQMGLPDAVLKKDSLVRFIRGQFGFSLVQTDAGETGWVPSDTLQAAPDQVLLEHGLVYDPQSPAVLTEPLPTPFPTPFPTAQPKLKVNNDSAIVARYPVSNPPIVQPNPQKDSAIVRRYDLSNQSPSSSGAQPSPSISSPP
jgi:hypothetical protein